MAVILLMKKVVNEIKIHCVVAILKMYTKEYARRKR